MANLVIGDFRSIQLQQYQNRSSDITLNYTYLVEDAAEYSWFETNAVAQLPLMSLNNSNVIIMLGFNDCVYSCVWSAFNIESIAASYVNIINNIIEQYPSLNFYVSSVNPVDSDYPFAAYEGGVIPQDKLDEKINQFNNIIKARCEATYIDCYKYLSDTSFSTRDGVRYISDTCDSLFAFISGNLKPTVGNQFIPRLVAPVVNSEDIESDLYWVSTAYNGGLNPFTIPSSYTKSAGDTLPNDTSYAWGRFYEIIDARPKLGTGSAETWFTNTSDGYQRGQAPALGAIACWEGAGTGHVAVVEQINSDGSIVTSESGLNDTRYWWTTTRTNSNNNWGETTLTFKGFIYCPMVTPTASVDGLDKTTVVSKAEALTRAEMEANARYIWNYLGSKGWSLNAVAGMLGNMQYESSINPGRHQVGSDENGGYGLVQWTPKRKLTEWLSSNGYAEDDMDGQLERIIWEKENNQQYAKNKYKYTFETFSTSLDNPYTLACAFAFDYERSWVTLYGTEAEKEALRKKRGGAAEEWYSFLAPYAPTTVAEEKFTLEGFKLDTIKPTEVEASFIIRNGNNGYYTLLDAKDTELLKRSLSISSDGTLQVISFKCTKELVPNTEYTLRVEATGTVGENTIVKSINFTTPQDLPGSVKSVKLSCKDDIKSINSTFSLSIEKPDTLGYWNQTNGYEEILIVNNKPVKTNVINNVKNITTEKFTIKNEFGYDCRADDIIQIGIRVWVKDNKNKKIYDAPVAKTSETVCLLNSSIQTYLNK